MKTALLAVCGSVLLLAPPLPAVQAEDSLEAGKFSTEAAGQAIPRGWRPLTFRNVERHTRYELVKNEGSVVVKARSEASASALAREIGIDPREYPILRWRWKAGRLLFGDIPIAALNSPRSGADIGAKDAPTTGAGSHSPN